MSVKGEEFPLFEKHFPSMINDKSYTKKVSLCAVLAVYHHLNLYRFNSVACVFSAWPDCPLTDNG